MFNFLVLDHFFDFFEIQFHFVETSMEAVRHLSAMLPPHGRLLHIVIESAADDTPATTAFLYLSEDQFSALSEFAKGVLALRKVATCPTGNASTEQALLYLLLRTRTQHLILVHREPSPCQCYVFLNYRICITK